MKKFLTLILVLTLLTSCSGDDNPGTTTPPEETALRLKKVISTNENGDIISYDYNYENDKLKSITGSDNSSTIYTYEANNITTKEINSKFKIETSTKYNDENKVISQIKLVESLTFNVKFVYKELYTYNEDGTITVDTHEENLESQTENHYSMTISYPTENTMEQLTEDGTKMVYTYDGKNNPLKNNLETNTVNTQNILTGVQILSSNSTTIFENTYIYNSKNYPISSVGKTLHMDKYETIKKQYFYE